MRIDANLLNRIFPGESEMARRMRAFDWSASELGWPQCWPQNLQASVALCLTSRFPISLWWGPRLLLLYNDAYLPWLSEDKRSRALMWPGREVWSEVWDVIGPMLDGVMATGQATWSSDTELTYDRTLRQEEVFISWSFGPIVGADGRTVDGVFCSSAENTEKVIGARRLETLRRLGIRSPEARTVDAACQEAAAVLRENSRDIPFAAIYVVEGDQARLAASVIPPGEHRVPPTVSAAEDDAASPWPLARVLRSKRAADRADLEAHGVRIRGGHWPELTRDAVVLPVQAAHEQLAGLLLVGVSPRRPLDAAYRTFFELIAGHIGTAIADARATDAEQRRAEALAELRESGEQAEAMTRLHELSTCLLAQTERKHAEDALRKSHERIEMILSSIPDRFFAVDSEWRYTHFNEQAEKQLRALGKNPASFLGRTLWEEFPNPPTEDVLRRAMSDRVAITYVHYYAPLGEWVETRIYPSPDGGLAMFVTYVTAQKRAEEEMRRSEAALRVYQQQLQELTTRLIEAQEMQSKHLARELHDVFSQKLAVIGMEIASLAHSPLDLGQAMEGPLLKLTDQIGSLAREIHRMARQLHPAILDDLGLSAAIKSECLAFSEQYHMPAVFISENISRHVAEDISLCLYRVAQESLHNIGKHAGVSEVRVGLSRSADEIVLAIDDSGNGFDPDGIKGKRGLGLVSMEERLRILGGTLSIRSQPGTGTHVEARVPTKR